MAPCAASSNMIPAELLAKVPVVNGVNDGFSVKYSGTYPTCTGMIYEEPTLEQLRASVVGKAIENGKMKRVRHMFDGPSGWRYLLYRLFIDPEWLWTHAVHGLSIAVSKPHDTTGRVADYLWEKVVKGYPNGFQVEESPYSQLASKGECLILNAYQNGHHQLLNKMLKLPSMQYGICESIRQAIATENIFMLKYLFAQGVQCDGDVLHYAFKTGHEVPAFWLIENKIGLNWCDQHEGSPLHVAIQKKSALLSRLILDIPITHINCSTNYIEYDKSQEGVRHKATALNLLFDQRPLDEKIIELLMRRGGVIASGSSNAHWVLFTHYRNKFGLKVKKGCFVNAATNQEACYPLRALGW